MPGVGDWKKETTRGAAPRRENTSACRRGGRGAGQPGSMPGRSFLQIPAALIREQGSSGWPWRFVPQREQQRLTGHGHEDGSEDRRCSRDPFGVGAGAARRFGGHLRRVGADEAALTVGRCRSRVRGVAAPIDLGLGAATRIEFRVFRGAAACRGRRAAAAVGLGREQIAATDRNQRLEEQAEDDAQADHRRLMLPGCGPFGSIPVEGIGFRERNARTGNRLRDGCPALLYWRGGRGSDDSAAAIICNAISRRARCHSRRRTSSTTDPPSSRIDSTSRSTTRS